MPITGYLGPAANEVVSPYRPIIYNAFADSVYAVDQPIYADVYIDWGLGNFFYKTLTAYSLFQFGGVSFAQFDVKDALQEFITNYYPTIPVNDIQPSSSSAYGVGAMLTSSMIKFFCLFRGSSITLGVVTPEGPIPIQGTVTSAPVSGGGFPTNMAYALNSSIPSNYDNIYQNKPLSFLGNVRFVNSVYAPDTQIYPLSNLPSNPQLMVSPPNYDACPRVYKNDRGGFPIFIRWFGDLPGYSKMVRNCQVYVMYYGPGTAAAEYLMLSTRPVYAGATYYLPKGLAEIASLSGSFVVDDMVRPNGNFYYRILLWDRDAMTQAFVSPLYKACSYASDHINIWFRNNYGHYEQVPFERVDKQVKTSSKTTFKPYNQTLVPATYPATGFGNPYYLDAGNRRNNVKMIEETTVTASFSDYLMEWLQDMLTSTSILIENTDVVSTNSFRSAMIQDGSLQIKRKFTDRGMINVVTFTLITSIEQITLRS